MSEAKKYYDKVKHQDDWGVDVVYPTTVNKIIELAEYEGILLGLKLCKEMFAQGQLTHENIYETEVYYKKMLETRIEK